MKTTKALFAVATVAASALLWPACTRGAQLALAHGTAQAAQQPSKAAVAARVASAGRGR